MKIDKIDLAILRALVSDGRASLQSVSELVRLQRPSVHARVKRLEATGVIEGYAARVSPDAVGAGLLAFAFLRVTHGKGNDCMVACGSVADALRKIPGVVEFHTLAGEEDALVKVRARDIRELEEIVMREISGLPGVERVRTNIVLSTHLDRPVAIRDPDRGRPRT